MNSGYNRLVIALVGLGLIGIVAPTSEAESKAIHIGVLAEQLDLTGNDVPPAVSLHRMTVEDLSEKRLAKMDALVLDQADADAIAADPDTRDRLRSFALAGNPAFLVGGTTTLPETLGIPALGADLAYVDGAPVAGEQSLHGLFIHPDGAYDTLAYAFESLTDLNGKAAGKAGKFAQDFELMGKGRKASFSTMSHGGSHAYWSVRSTANYCVEKAPYGELCYTAFFNRLEFDSSSTYDWWTVEMLNTASGGIAAWGNTWRNHKTWSTSDTDYYRLGNKLVAFGGPSAYNLYPLGFTVGTTAGVEGALETVTLGGSYDLRGIANYQASWAQYNDFYVRHEFDYGSLHTSLTYTSEPAFTVRVDQGSSLKIPYGNKAEFYDYVSGGYGQIYINSWREIFP